MFVSMEWRSLISTDWNMRSIVNGIVALSAIVMTGCDRSSEYRGDGTLTSENVFPFTIPASSLELPEIDLNTSGRHEFNIGSLGDVMPRPWIVLEVSASKAIPFHKLDVFLSLTIRELDGDVIFSKVSKLNSHYMRMMQEREVSSPNDNEWLVRYKYDSHALSAKGIPFSLTETPRETSSMRYVDMRRAMLEPGKEYSILLRVQISQYLDDSIQLRGWLSLGQSPK